MTVIAYRNGVMACDALWSDNGTCESHATKIARLRSGALYGAAGDSDDRALVALLQNVKKPAKLPSRKKLQTIGDDVAALLVFPNGEVWKLETGKKDNGAYRIHAPFAAIGSGADVALGAMGVAAGVTAREAVEVACRLTTLCRPPVYALRLYP